MVLSKKSAFIYFLFMLITGVVHLFSVGFIHLFSLISLFLLISIFPIVFTEKYWPASPLVWCLILYFWYYGVGGYFSIYSLQALRFKLPESIIYMQMYYALLCSICLMIGYYVFKKFKIPSFKYELKENKLHTFLIIIIIVSAIAKVFIVATGNYYHAIGDDVVVTINLPSYLAGLVQIFQFLSQLSVLALVIAGVLYWRLENKYYKWILFALIFATIGYESFSGSKERVLLPVFFAIITYVYAKRKVPVTALIITFFVTQFVVFPLYNIYRSPEQYKFTEAIELYQKNFDLTDVNKLSSTFEEISSSRMNASGIMGSILYEHSHGKDFHYGKDYLSVFEALIPRIVYPGKARLAGGNKFGHDYKILNENDNKTSVGRYWQGEAFINFGWAGCLIGILFGGFLAFIEKYFLQHGLIFSFFLFMIMGYSFLRYDQFPSFINGIFKFFLFYFVFCFPFLKKE